jgi:pimeloyl-ACP methyl ester carboxylesterase
MMMKACCGLAYRRSGDGAPVVLLHGIPGQGVGWQRVEPLLVPRFDVITPDLIGFGASDGPATPSIDNVGPAAQAAGVARLLDELGVRDAAVVGHDFGAPVALLLGAARPDLVSALVLLAGNAFPDTPVPFPLSLTTAPLIGGLCARVLFSSPSLALMLRQGTGSGTAPPDRATSLGDRRQRRTIAAIFRGALTHLADVYVPVAAALEGAAVPLVVGWGDRDPFFPVAQGQRTAEQGRGRLRVFEGAGHFLPHERAADVAAEIAAVAAAAAEGSRSGTRWRS